MRPQPPLSSVNFVSAFSSSEYAPVFESAEWSSVATCSLQIPILPLFLYTWLVDVVAVAAPACHSVLNLSATNMKTAGKELWSMFWSPRKDKAKMAAQKKEKTGRRKTPEETEEYTLWGIYPYDFKHTAVKPHCPPKLVYNQHPYFAFFDFLLILIRIICEQNW